MNELLSALKIDLGITTDAYDTRLLQILQSAKHYITIEGINLEESIDDQNMVIMYAGWLWQKRRENVPMPRSLRWAMNNRLMKEKSNG